MKNLKTDTGWTETIVKKFIITSIKLQFQSIKEWINFHIKNPKLNSSTRSHCNRCKVKWKDMNDKEGWVNLAIMQGDTNKVLCSKCAVEVVANKF